MPDPVATHEQPALAADVCVLMPVHVGTPAAHLALALSSIGAQTVAPGCVLLVQDGELEADHEDVISAASARMPALRVVRPGAVGLVGALTAGLACTDATWIARMDADDVAEPQRLERQLGVTCEHVDVIGSAMVEFDVDPERLGPVRSMPQTHGDIVAALRRVNPVNHPTVMMRRSVIDAVGGYAPLSGMEDYLLWARLAAAGARFHNLPEPLVRYRVDHESYQRRADPAAIKAEWVLQRHLRHLGLAGPMRSATNLVMRVAFRLLPPVLMRPAYAVVRSTLARRSSATQ